MDIFINVLVLLTKNLLTNENTKVQEELQLHYSRQMIWSLGALVIITH